MNNRVLKAKQKSMGHLGKLHVNGCHSKCTLVLNMVVSKNYFIGTTSDGEFCSLRTQGETRALHIWQLVHDAREEARRMSKTTLLSLLKVESSEFNNSGDHSLHSIIDS